MKKILITEAQYRYLLAETDSRIKRVQKIIRDMLKGVNAIPDSIVNSSEFYVDDNPNTTWVQYILHHLRDEYGLMSNSSIKYLPTVAEVAINELGFDQNAEDTYNLGNLKKIVNFVQANQPKYDDLFLDKDFQTMLDNFYDILKGTSENEKLYLNSTTFVPNNDYEILTDINYDTAHKFGYYHSCPKSIICYSKNHGTWDTYIREGLNKAYLLLRKGWENVPCEHTQPHSEICDEFVTDAYDDYGLSMIFVFVDPDGELVTSNTRWNHKADYGQFTVDNAFSKKGISHLIGRNFNDVFTGYSTEELEAKGLIKVRNSDVPKLLAQGVNPKQIFKWIDIFQEGFARVRLNRRYNFLTQNNTLLFPDLWFKWVNKFQKGFAKVYLLNGEVKWVDANCNFYDQMPQINNDSKNILVSESQFKRLLKEMKKRQNNTKRY